MLKIRINPKLCSGCGTCSVLAPGVFELDTEIYLSKVKSNAPELPKDKLDKVVSSCPAGAITLEEEKQS